MRTPVTRHRASTLLVASMAVGLLAACGTATAPGLETPTPVSTGSSTPGSGQSSSPGSSQSSSPGSSGAATGDTSGAGLCIATGTNYGPQYSSAAVLKPFGATATASTSYGTSVEVSAQAPRVVSSPEEQAPADGNEYVAIDVRAHLAKGSSYYLSYIEFSLFDPTHAACNSKNYADVLPASKMLKSTSLGDKVKDVAGSIVFQVKAGADLTKLTLLFGVSSSDPANVGWKS